MSKALPFVALLAVAIALPAWSRTPSAEERASVEATLRSEGYATWGVIELDDDWEVESARRPGSQQECDITIDAKSFKVLETECE